MPAHARERYERRRDSRADEDSRFYTRPHRDQPRAPYDREQYIQQPQERGSHPQQAPPPHGQPLAHWDARTPVGNHWQHHEPYHHDRLPQTDRGRVRAQSGVGPWDGCPHGGGPWRDEPPERRGVGHSRPYERNAHDARQGPASEAGASEADGWAQRRAHYDRQAQPGHSRTAALRERGRGPLIAYKKAANALKRAQIEARRGVALLADVGCGRGGDIGKWWDARVGYVIATDLAPKQLDEARRRQAEMTAERARHNGFVGRIDWHACNSADGALGERLLRWSGGRRYGALSCQFALHFFFGDEAGARALLRAVAEALVDGGEFFGIAPDGDAILALTAAHGGSYEMVEPFALRVQLVDGGGAADGGPAPAGPADRGAFGRLATFALDDTVTAGSDDSECSEFLLHPAVLRALARDEGLEPIEEQCGPMLEQLARATRLAPLSAPLQQVASLYFCFAFVKVGAPSGGRAPAES